LKQSFFVITKDFLQIGRYLSRRTVVLLLTAVAGVWVTLMAANLGGLVDTATRNLIAERVTLGSAGDPALRALEPAARTERLNQMIAAAQDAAGLNEPLIIRTTRAVGRALTLDLGNSRTMRTISPEGPDRTSVRRLIGERLPATLLLFAVSNIVIFLTSVAIALYFSRRYGSLFDKLIVVLSPASSAPGWFYGLFLIAVFAGIWNLFPFGGMRPSPPPESPLLYALGMLRHMVLPFAAVFLSTFFQSIYIWRTFFLIYADEDYVEMARAKGLSAGLINRRYILRPTLPPILTNFAFIILGAWSGSVVLEVLFNWPGLGELFFIAIRRNDASLIVGLAVIYAYFLALTILILDIAYVLVDPRLKVDGQNQSGALKSAHIDSSIRRRLLAHRHRPTWAGLRRLVGKSLEALRQAPGALVEAGRMLLKLGSVGRETLSYPTAVVGMLIILLMLVVTAHTVVAMPLDQAVSQWRATTEIAELPRNARPAWFNYFTKEKRPLTTISNSQNGSVAKQTAQLSGLTEVTITHTVDYQYDDFPPDLIVSFHTGVVSKAPHVTMQWITPDGREIRLGQLSPRNNEVYQVNNDSRVIRRLGGLPPHQGLFADPDQEDLKVLKGEYQLVVNGILFEDDSELDSQLVVYGQLHGLGGTDNRRRDLAIPLLWGMPVALFFGFLAAGATTVLTLIIAGFGAWYGGWLDGLIQRLTEINLVLPLIPILAMATLLFTLRIWQVLGVAVLLSIFGSNIKTYRAIFLQARQAPYIEAAQAYGSGHARIVFYYLVPRLLPVVIPQLVLLVPYYVFLEATLAFLGLGDPYLPTWGKLINDAHTSSALLSGHYYWILQPAFLLLLTGFAFAMVGFALERIFNPRLRGL
jgi:peptide/nickel transport system permease protein